jgi:hypothetical protein
MRRAGCCGARSSTVLSARSSLPALWTALDLAAECRIPGGIGIGVHKAPRQNGSPWTARAFTASWVTGSHRVGAATSSLMTDSAAGSLSSARLCPDIPNRLPLQSLHPARRTG